MKLSTTLLLLLQALFIAAEALPINFGQRQDVLQQQPPQRPGPVPVNSWDSSSSGSSDSTSGSKSSTKNSFLESLKSATTITKPFKCHHRPTQPILRELALYVTDILKRHRDEIFDRKGGADIPPFEVCMGGYDSTNVSPAIMIKEMTKRQVERLERIARSQVLIWFPNVKVVKSGNGLALVEEKREGLTRRNTV